MTAIAIFGLATTTIAQVPSYVPTNGLVGWWPFNGNANDESGNGNNGNVAGATLTADRFGVVNMAYSFDGDDDFIDCGTSTTLGVTSSTVLSISFWFKRSLGGEFPIICKYQNYIGNNSNFYVGSGSTDILLSGDGSNSFLASNSSSDWNHCTVLISSGTNSTKVYLNGSLIQTGTLNLSPTLSTWNLFFGRLYGLTIIPETGLYSTFNSGLLDDIGIWNRVLTICEIQDLYDVQLGSQAISAGLDQTLCSGDSVTLSASGGSNYQWSNNVLDGQPFAPTQSNAYVVNGTDTLGCQGSDTLMITVLENATSTLNETALDSYTLNGQTYTESGTYTQTVPAANGCDSVITLNLTLNFTGLSQEESTLFVLYPNPASEQITIKTDAGMIGKEYALYNQVGKLITKGKLTGENTSLSLQGLARGLYSIAIQGQEMKSFTISKE